MLLIIRLAGLVPHRRRPLSSNVRRRKPHCPMLLQILQAWLTFLLLAAAWFTLKVYARRRTRNTKTPLVGEISRPNDCNTVARRADPTNILRSYDVLIDGKPVGTIAAGAVSQFPVEDGCHTVSIKVDWCKCQELPVEKRADENVLLWCGATYNDWRCIFMGFLQPKRYVYVRPAAASDA